MIEKREQILKILMFFVYFSLGYISFLGILDVLFGRRTGISLLSSLAMSLTTYNIILLSYVVWYLLEIIPILDERTVQKYKGYIICLSLTMAIISVLYVTSTSLSKYGMILSFMLSSLLLIYLDPKMGWNMFPFIMPAISFPGPQYPFYLTISLIVLYQECFKVIKKDRYLVLFFMIIYITIFSVFLEEFRLAFIFLGLMSIILFKGSFLVLSLEIKRKFTMIASYVNVLLALLLLVTNAKFYPYFNYSSLLMTIVSFNYFLIDMSRRGGIRIKRDLNIVFPINYLAILFVSLFGLSFILNEKILFYISFALSTTMFYVYLLTFKLVFQ